jgi:hypothetical protein
VRAEQTVAKMVVVALARQAEALSEGTDRPLEEAFAQVLKTPAGRLLGELADGPHRHEKAADWQEGLIADRVARRKARRPPAREGGYGAEQPCERAEEGETFARLLELELAPKLDVGLTSSSPKRNLWPRPTPCCGRRTGWTPRYKRRDARRGDGLDLVRELEEDGGGVEPLPRLMITADPEHSVAARAMEASASGPAFRGGEDVRSRGRRLD